MRPAPIARSKPSGSARARDFAVETVGTLLGTVIALVVGLVGAVVVAWATAALFRIVLEPGATDLRAAITAAAALFVVAAGLFLGVAVVQKIAEVHHRHRARDVAAAAAADAASMSAQGSSLDEPTAAHHVPGSAGQ